MSRVLTLMLPLYFVLGRLFCLCRCPPFMCYMLALSFLLLGVDFGFNFISFYNCWRLVSRVFDCFIRSFKPSKTSSNKLFAYPLTRLLEIQWMSQYGCFSSYYHIGVCTIFEEIIQFNERFVPTLKSLWRATDLLFKRNLLIPTVHWMILSPLEFVNV
jgi:hypothetical protein